MIDLDDVWEKYKFHLMHLISNQQTYICFDAIQIPFKISPSVFVIIFVFHLDKADRQMANTFYSHNNFAFYSAFYSEASLLLSIGLNLRKVCIELQPKATV